MKRLCRFGPVVLLSIGVPLLFSSCLEPPAGGYHLALQGTSCTENVNGTNPVAVDCAIDEPDPSLQPFGNIFGAFTQVYGSGGCGAYQCMGFAYPIFRIPTYTLLYPPVPTTGNVTVTDALCDGAGTCQMTSGFTWAPTTIYVGGQYVMAFANPNTGHNCIVEATSSDGFHYTLRAFQLCSSNPSSSWLIDPQFFLDNSSGQLYLLYSDELQSACLGGPGSAIYIVPMSSNGLTPAGNPTELLDWNEADAVQFLPSNLGTTPCLENPNIINDSTGGWNPYDLMFSIGQYNLYGGSTYVTGEVDCLALNDTGTGCGVDPGAGSLLVGEGGTTTLNTSNASSNYLMYAQGIFGLRQDFVGGPTTRCDPSTDPNVCT